MKSYTMAFQLLQTNVGKAHRGLTITPRVHLISRSIHTATKQVFKVGSRDRMKFWKDKWCRGTPLRDLFLNIYSIASSNDAWVVDV